MGTPTPRPETTTCAVAGGGPAGMVLGLLLARAGVDVTVLEKHADFLRDFRGDTVHASTLRLLDELGLGGRFAALPHRLIETLDFRVQNVPVSIDLRRLPGAHQHIALVPQWDLLELLAGAAAAEPTFRLMREAEVCGVIGDGRGRVAGLTYRDPDGAPRRLHADLTVACDGRASTLRSALGRTPRSFGAPMDVWWFRLPRHPTDPRGLSGVLSAGRATILIDRGDYFQVAYLIPKGANEELRDRGIDTLRRALAAQVPVLADRVDALRGFDDVKLLDVQVNRLHRWCGAGVLFLGDAAHAMSPVGGVGINLAVADAVAAARMLAGPLRTGRGAPRTRLAAVQARRWLPAAVTQAVQRTIHAEVIAAAIAPDGTGGPGRGPSRAVRLVSRAPALRRLAGRAVAIGPLPERTPGFARRPAPGSGHTEPDTPAPQ